MNIHTAQLHLGDLMGGTSHMKAAEFGAYLLLLVAAYQIGNHRLPDDDQRLSMMARVTGKQWQKIRPVVMHKFIHKQDEFGSYYVHERIQKEVLKFELKSSKNRDNALKRWNTEMPIASDSQCDRNAIHNPISKNITSTSSFPTTAQEVLINGNGKWKVDHHLSDKARASARAAAPGWDMHELMRAYDAYVEKVGVPNNVEKAFPAFCKRHTRGKEP